MTLGENIQKHRRKKGLTQATLAREIGVATGTIQQYELNKRQPRIEQLRRIAAALGVTLDAFIDLNTDELTTLTRPAAEMRNRLLEGAPRTRQEAEDWKESILVENYRKLNKTGRSRLIEDSENYTYNPKYTEPGE